MYENFLPGGTTNNNNNNNNDVSNKSSKNDTDNLENEQQQQQQRGTSGEIPSKNINNAKINHRNNGSSELIRPSTRNDDSNNATRTFSDDLSHSVQDDSLCMISENPDSTINYDDKKMSSAVPRKNNTTSSRREVPRMSSMPSLTSSKRDNLDQQQRISPINNEGGGGFLTETYHNPNAVASTDATRPAHFDAKKFLTDKAQQNNQRWQKLASRIDEYSRLIIPVLYMIFLTTMFSKAKGWGDNNDVFKEY